MSNQSVALRPVEVNDPATVIERVVMQGDLSKLTPVDRVMYYRQVCDSLGLNPLTRPFDYIQLSGKLTLYAKRDCADQLRRRYGVSIPRLNQEQVGDLYIVTAYASMPDGRSDSDMGAVSVAGLKGEALANAMLKAVTKAKRRVTLSICGLGMLDETEVESVPGTAPLRVDAATGEILPLSSTAVVPQAPHLTSDAPLPSNAPPDTPVVPETDGTPVQTHMGMNGKRAAWQRLHDTAGWWPADDDKEAIRQAIGALLGRTVESLRDLTTTDVEAARTELEARNTERRRYYAIAGAYKDADEDRGRLAQLIRRPVISRRDITSAEWRYAADAIEMPPADEPPDDALLDVPASAPPAHRAGRATEETP